MGKKTVGGSRPLTCDKLRTGAVLGRKEMRPEEGLFTAKKPMGKPQSFQSIVQIVDSIVKPGGREKGRSLSGRVKGIGGTGRV